MAAVVSVLLTFALAGCGSDDDKGNDGNGGSGGEASGDVCKTADGDGPKIGLAYDVGGRGDQSFNDSAYAGVEKAVEDLDATCIEAEAGSDENDTARAERLRTLASEGYNPVIAVGFIYSPAAAEVAADFPDTDFTVIDGYASSITEADNLSDINFAANEGSFLVGVAAALETKSGTVGFVGGTNGALIQGFQAGFEAGVKAADPKVKVQVQYLTDDPNDGKTGFENAPGGRTAAEGMLDSGADVIFHAAGKSGLGVFQAVEAAGEGNWAIGVDSDQYLTAEDSLKPFILTSMLKRIDVGVSDYVTAFDKGETPSGFITYDLADDGVGYSTENPAIDPLTSKINEFADKIKSGEIEVPTAP